MHQFNLTNSLFIKTANNPALRKLTYCKGIALFIISGFKYPGLLHGLPLLTLAYGNSRFCFLKITKPVHEHHLQAFPITFCKPAAVYRDELPDFKKITNH